MTRSFATIFLVFVFAEAWSQDTVATKQERASDIRQALKASNSSIQSANKISLSSFDSLKLDSLDKKKNKIDSLKNFVANKKSKVEEVTDSVKRIINLPSEKINQGVAVVQSQVDSLVQKINKPVDDFNNDVSEAQKSVQNKIDTKEQRVNEKIENVQNSVQQNVNKATDGQVKLPANNVQLSETGVNIPKDVGIAGLNDTKLPGVASNNPNLEIPGAEKLKVPEAQIDVKKLSEKADIKIPESDKTKNISGEINKIDGKLAEVQKYGEEIKNIKENGIGNAEKLPEEIEKQVGNIDEVKALNTEAQKVTEYQDMIERYKDKKLMQEEIKRKAKMVATEKLNELSPAFKEAQQTIAKAKKINPAVESFKDIVKKRPNEMKGKPFRQRFVPGVTFQVYNQDDFIMDCAAQAGYRITGRLTAGLGYTYRISFSKSHTNWVSGEGVSGYRIYSDFTLLKSFYIHGEFEALTIDRTRQPLLLETSDNHIYGSYFGLGKRYSITRKINGSVAGLYRVDYKGEVPGLSKVNFRIAFSCNLKKEKTKNFTALR